MRDDNRGIPKVTARSADSWLRDRSREISVRRGREEITCPSRRTPAFSSGLFPAEGAHGNWSNLKMRGFTQTRPFSLPTLSERKNIFKLNFNL